MWGSLVPPIGRLTLIGKCLPGYDRILLGMLPPSFQQRVTFAGSIPSDRLPEALTQFDVGLALEHRSPPNKDVTISNKILQYLNAGLSVVATPTQGQSEVFNGEPELGLKIALEAADAGPQLSAFLGSRDRISRSQRAARHAAEIRYCWEREIPSLGERVRLALNKVP